MFKFKSFVIGAMGNGLRELNAELEKGATVEQVHTGNEYGWFVVVKMLAAAKPTEEHQTTGAS